MSCFRTEVRSSRWNPIGSDARAVAPGSAALSDGAFWPEGATGMRVHPECRVRPSEESPSVRLRGRLTIAGGSPSGLEGAAGMRVLPGADLALPVESRRFGCEGGDTRFAGPAQASWPEAPTRGAFFLRAGGVRRRHPYRTARGLKWPSHRRHQRGFLVHPPQNLRAGRDRHRGRKPSVPSLPNRTAVEMAITPGGSAARRSRWNEGCDLRRGPACARPPGRRSQRGERFALTRIVRLPPLP